MKTRFLVSPRISAPFLQQDNGAGSGGGGGTGGGSNSNDDDKSSNDAYAGGQSGGEGGKQESVLTIPEREFKGRITREAKKQLEERARELGYASVAEMEAALGEHKRQKDQAKSELEREQEARKQAEAERDAMRATANERLIRAEVKVVATELGIVDPEAAYLLMAKDDVAVDDTGAVQGVKPALEALLSAKPYLKGEAEQSRTGVPATPRPSGNSNLSFEERVQAEYEARRNRRF